MSHIHTETTVKHGNRRTHGMTGTREYKAWKAMRSRCASNNPITFPHYKAKGITVCEHWNRFENFLSDMGSAPSAKHEIDRKDNDLGYFPENCQWATNTQNTRNRSVSLVWVIDGIEYESISPSDGIPTTNTNRHRS